MMIFTTKHFSRPIRLSPAARKAAACVKAWVTLDKNYQKHVSALKPSSRNYAHASAALQNTYTRQQNALVRRCGARISPPTDVSGNVIDTPYNPAVDGVYDPSAPPPPWATTPYTTDPLSACIAAQTCQLSPDIDPLWAAQQVANQSAAAHAAACAADNTQPGCPGAPYSKAQCITDNQFSCTNNDGKLSQKCITNACQGLSGLSGLSGAADSGWMAAGLLLWWLYS